MSINRIIHASGLCDMSRPAGLVYDAHESSVHLATTPASGSSLILPRSWPSAQQESILALHRFFAQSKFINTRCSLKKIP
jgi:hypothetical protein